MKKIDRTRFREEGAKRRQFRKQEESEELSRVTAYCQCDSFELTDILSMFSLKESVAPKPVLFSDVICFRDFKGPGRGDVFVFSYGVVVFWGFSEVSEQDFLHRISAAEEGCDN